MWGCLVYHISMDDTQTELCGRAQTPSLLLGLSISHATYFKNDNNGRFTTQGITAICAQWDTEVADSFLAMNI